MPGPFIFIATNRLRDGRFDLEQRRVPELSRFIEANEPRLIAFNEYVNEERSEVTVVQVHPDAVADDTHVVFKRGSVRMDLDNRHLVELLVHIFVERDQLRLLRLDVA